MWDERVPLHTASDFYDVEGFRAGRPQVEPFEVDELGALGGLRLAHLQCHFGLDTLDLVRMHPTLDAVGLDFSAPAVEAAQRLPAELGLGERARFVHADVHQAADVPWDAADSTWSTPARVRSAGSPICGPGQNSAPSCSSRRAGSTFVSSTPSGTASAKTPR